MYKEFTKDQLKTGMRVETRDKQLYLIIEIHNINTLINFNMQTCTSEKSYNDDLTNRHNDSKDIIKIYTIHENANYYDADILNPNTKHLIWEREEPKKMTQSEIEKELGYKIEILSTETKFKPKDYLGCKYLYFYNNITCKNEYRDSWRCTQNACECKYFEPKE